MVKFLKYMFFVLLLLLTGGSKYSINTWLSVSSLWGQGSAGLSLTLKDQKYSLSDSYVYDFKENEFEYNEIELLRSHSQYFEGLKLRYQYDDYELAPFIGRFDKVNEYFSFNNELEWRGSPYTGDSYLRSNHRINLFLLNYKGFRPFISILSYFDLEDVKIEKTRAYVGYLVEIGRVCFSAYYIPWRDGKEEMEWDDQKMFGAFIKFSL